MTREQMIQTVDATRLSESMRNAIIAQILADGETIAGLEAELDGALRSTHNLAFEAIAARDIAITALAEECRKREEIQANMDRRDNFIVDHDLWDVFVAGLPDLRRARAALRPVDVESDVDVPDDEFWRDLDESKAMSRAAERAAVADKGDAT